jgi:hypothetical protein
MLWQEEPQIKTEVWVSNSTPAQTLPRCVASDMVLASLSPSLLIYPVNSGSGNF